LDILHAWQVRLKAAGFFLLIMAYSPLQDCNKLQGHSGRGVAFAEMMPIGKTSAKPGRNRAALSAFSFTKLARA
jgi:hypothetical protein